MHRLSRRAILATPALLTFARAVAQPLSPQLAELYERAKGEREVTIWGPGATTIGWIPAEFAKRFPDVKVSFLGSEQAGARFITESRAGRNVVDVWSFSLGGTLDVQRRGLLQAIDWPAVGAEPEGIFFDGEAAAVNNHVSTPIFARSRLNADSLSRRYDALLDPAWTDKMVASSFLLPRMAAYLAIEWGIDRAERWMRELIDQRRTLISSAPVSDILFSGERQLAVAESVGAARRMVSAGFNVGYRIMEIVPASQFVISVTKRAPHPNAARLLVAWLLTPEAKVLYDRLAGLPDIRFDPESPVAQEIRAAGSKVIYENVETMGPRAEYYRRLSAIARGQG